MSNSNQTFSKERLERLEEFSKAINELHIRTNNIEKKCNEIREQALISVAPQINQLQDMRRNLINRMRELEREKEVYYQNTCGHLEYNDGEIHVCIWCGKDL